MSQDVVRARLTSALERCARHAGRLTLALEGVHALGALTEARLAAPTSEEADRIDLFLLAYMRLQDTMGGRLFPALLEAAGESGPESSAIDRLNALARLRILESQEAWLEARAIRNQLTHDYPEPAIRLQILLSALSSARLLQDTLHAVQDYTRRALGMPTCR